MKPVVFLGDSLSEFENSRRPRDVKWAWNCDRCSADLNHRTWKQMRSVGLGVERFVFGEAAGAFRVLYVANLVDAVYVLHAFQKKTRATAKRDLALAALRFRLL